MKTKNTKYLLISIVLLFSTSAVAQSAYTLLDNGDFQISTVDVQPLYLTGGAATISGTAVTFTPLITSGSNTQVWTITKGTSGNATDKYIIKSKNEAVPLNTQTTLKLTATGSIPSTDGKYHAHPIYRLGDAYAIKIAAGIADVTTTYSAKFWKNSNDSLRLNGTSTTLPVSTDYIVKFIPYTGTGFENITAQKVFCSNTPTGLKILNQEGIVSIYKINGELIKDFKINGNVNVELVKGFYIVRLKSGMKNMVQKVIVK